MQNNIIFKDSTTTVICDDVVSIEHELVVDPNKAVWIIDPPWDQFEECFIRAGKYKLVFCDTYYQQDVYKLYGAPKWIFIWDCVTNWYKHRRPLKQAKLAFWYGDYSDYNFHGYHTPWGDNIPKAHNVKNENGKYKYTPCKGKHLTDIYRTQLTKLLKHSDKSHAKPVEWIKLMLGNCFPPELPIIDAFAGTGSCTIASRELGRTVIAVDNNRKKCEQLIKNIK